MSKIIAASINLTKIDKSRIVEGKTGAKYYNISIIINDEKDKFGNDVSITEGQTKEERAEKKERVFIGNGKTIWEGQKQNSTNNDLAF